MSNAVKGKPYVAMARIPPEAGGVRVIQIYYDGVNDKKVVLQCQNGNWLFDADLNMIVPMVGGKTLELKRR